MEEVKQYGVYTGTFNEEGIKAVQTCTELELYFTINAIGGFLWRMRHDSAHGRIEMTDRLAKELEEFQYSIEYAVLQTKRFGVEIPEPKPGEHVQRTEQYDKWFRWWDEYVQHKLTDDEFKEIESLMAKKQDLSKFRPDGDWRQ